MKKFIKLSAIISVIVFMLTLLIMGLPVSVCAKMGAIFKEFVILACIASFGFSMLFGFIYSEQN